MMGNEDVMAGMKHFKINTVTRWKILVCAVAVALFLSGCGEKKPKVCRIGILNGFLPFSGIIDGFKAKMNELGHIEGQNITYDVRRVEIGSSQERQVLEQFVADGVDLIVAFPTGAAIAAKAASQGTKTPVVFAMANLEGINLVQSVRLPGQNITGVRTPGPEIVLKRLEFLLEISPQIKRVYTTYNENYPVNKHDLEALRPAVSSLGITLVEAPVTSVEGIQSDLEDRTASDDIGLDAILIISDDLSQSPTGWPLISKFARKHKVPVVGGAANLVETGAVMCYVPDYIETGKLAAVSADKIHKGISAGTIPVTTAAMSLRINYKKAEELGLNIPIGLLSLANEIVR